MSAPTIKPETASEPHKIIISDQLLCLQGWCDGKGAAKKPGMLVLPAVPGAPLLHFFVWQRHVRCMILREDGQLALSNDCKWCSLRLYESHRFSDSFEKVSDCRLLPQSA